MGPWKVGNAMVQLGNVITSRGMRLYSWGTGVCSLVRKYGGSIEECNGSVGGCAGLVG
jgi:hypothetical protein